MKIYLVGGAVRDELLNLPIIEKDYVVVGATVDEMLKQGYQQVGKDFPVFLHPKTKAEYALARVERKVSRGYTGFSFDASPLVTLEEDLLRRDLTINAIAKDEENNILIDPFHGQEDLNNKILRHVSRAFIEDPVRILRLARFAARFAELGFTVADDTMVLMREMVKSGEVDALVPERVWKELERALQEKHAEKFFEVLAECDALPVLFPTIKEENIEALKKSINFPDTIKKPEDFKELIQFSKDPEVRLASLLSGHSAPQIKELCSKYRLPSSYQELALLVSIYYGIYLDAVELNAEEFLKFFQAVDAFRREGRFRKFLYTCMIIDAKAYSFNIEYIFKTYDAAKYIDVKNLKTEGLSGKEIGDLINVERLKAIANFLQPRLE